MPIDPPALGPLLGNTVSTVISPFYTLFSTNATYCFTACTNLTNHRTETETLEGNLLRVEQRITDGERNGLIPTAEAERWVQRANQAISEEAANRESFGNMRRIFGCSLNCWGNYKTSKQAAEKVDVVRKCIISTPLPENITRIQPPPPVQEMPGTSMSAESRNLQYALQYIKDDPTVGMIGIWGPGGVGKTHLLININNSLGEGMTFNFVLFVTASRGCSVEKVQSQIIERLGLQVTGSESKIRATIYEYLKTKSFLVLLDDLWDKINLENVGIPYPLGNVENLKRKLVLTTRLRKVCGQMEVRKELKVPYLQEHEAWQLFERKIGAETLSSPYIEALARVLMKELKGLPLALTTIGKAMYQKDTAQWETAIQYMRQSCCTDDKDPIELGMETNVFRQLKFSYDNLRNKTLRDCFLTCALWQEDARIPKVDLAQCWMGLGLVNEKYIESSFTKSYSLIAELTAVCLLEDIEDSYGFVKVHDVIRDMAVWISCDCGENNDKWIVRAPAGEDKKVIIPWDKAEYISLMSNRLTELDHVGFNPDPIKLRILCLRGNRLNEKVVAEAIKNCTSLTYLDLSSNSLRSIPEELCSFEKLEYLNLSENELQLTELPLYIGKLVNLKFLYLTNTSIRTIPSEVISSLKALQVIDLRTVWELYGITVREPYLKGRAYSLGVLFREFDSLPQLKALGITAIGFDEFDSLRVAANLPLRYLTLIKLDKLCLSDFLLNYFARSTLYDLVITSCDNLEQIIVRHDTRQPNNHFSSLNQLSIFLVPKLKEIAWMGPTPASILPRLTYLEVCSCDSLLHLSWVMYLPRLEQIHILQCDSMVQAFMRCHGDKLCNVQEKKITFPCLKFLYLQGNQSLDTIGDDGMEFPSLEKLVLMQCPTVKRLPFQLNSMPVRLKELGFYDVQEWERLEFEEGVKTFLRPALKFCTYRF